MLKIDRTKRYDQTGFYIRLNGRILLGLHWWSIWRPNPQRNDWGFVFKFNPFPCRVGRGSASWRSWPRWRRAIQPGAWLQRSLVIARNCRGGGIGERRCGDPYWLGYTRRKRLVGWVNYNGEPYSFR
jgi:hypothetical protein